MDGTAAELSRIYGGMYTRDEIKTFFEGKPAKVAAATDYEALWRRRGERMRAILNELVNTRHERDMLAARCAEQAHKIAELMAPPANDLPKATILDAIRTMQRGGVR